MSPKPELGPAIPEQTILGLEFRNLFLSWLDPYWFAIISPYLEPVHLRIQLQPHRDSGVSLCCKLKVTPTPLSFEKLEAAEGDTYALSLMSPNPDFCPSFLHQLGP
ncbi:hypothetical protein RF11_03428 [Thelohanellus kitauei]|uniref:Uncharacterized protein n=1 Tax=Thelohanellus kitauei TaxID=669202 RepID=A0A0C2MHI1_THEKT|nr:hypothetical protein RF11_03428 [Thelohanellus kitauei]